MHGIFLSFKKDFKMAQYILQTVIESLRLLDIKSLSHNPTKWLNTLKQFVGKNQ